VKTEEDRKAGKLTPPKPEPSKSMPEPHNGMPQPDKRGPPGET
jgi:hypothetical protein